MSTHGIIACWISRAEATSPEAAPDAAAMVDLSLFAGGRAGGCAPCPFAGESIAARLVQQFALPVQHLVAYRLRASLDRWCAWC